MPDWKDQLTLWAEKNGIENLGTGTHVDLDADITECEHHAEACDQCMPDND